MLHLLACSPRPPYALEMNCLIRVENVARRPIAGYERPSREHRDLYVYEIPSTNGAVEEQISRIRETLSCQKDELKAAIERGASICLFIDYRAVAPIRLERDILLLLGKIGMSLEVFRSNADENE